MSYETTEAILAIGEVAPLAEAIRARIRGEYGDPPVHDDWTWTTAVSRAVSFARQEPRRGRMARAILDLLGVLSSEPQDGAGPAEWPAGLLRAVQQVAWGEDEKRATARRLVGLLLEVERWPLGLATATSLGSSALELHRAVRALAPMLPFSERALVQSIRRLLPGPSSEAGDWELGALLGIHASYEGQAVLAMRFLRDLGGERRDRVLFALDREYVAWIGTAQPLGRPLIEQFERRCHDSLCIREQVWAIDAAPRFGAPEDPFVVRAIERGRRPPSAADLPRTAPPACLFR